MIPIAISTQLPAFQARVLSGADNVKFWTEQWTWDDILRGIRIVVSTHQVLLEALEHGFIRMSKLALLVFDEAHSCVGNHPSSRILRDFYHVSSKEGRPYILGLTASPVVNGNVGNLGWVKCSLIVGQCTQSYDKASAQFPHDKGVDMLESACVRPVFDSKFQHLPEH